MVPIFGLIASLLGLIVLGTFDAVDYNLNGMIFMCHYRAALNVIVVACTTIFYLLVLGFDGLLRKLNPPTKSVKPASPTARQGTARAFWFLLCACCDTIALYISLLASNSVTSSLRSILQQATIPFSMIVSHLILKRRFGWGHIIGAVLIVCGIVACLASIGFTSDQISDPVWSLVFTLSCIPLAVGACLKEWLMTHPKRPANIHMVNAATAGFQLMLSIVLYPAALAIQDSAICVLGNASIPQNGTIGIVNASEAVSNFWDGVQCGLAGVSPTNSSWDAGCGYAVLTVWLAIITIAGFVVPLQYIT